MPVLPGHDQGSYRVRCEWGPVGASAVVAPGDVAVVVDVLSFTTTTTLAVAGGVRVLPFAWRDERAAAHARTHDAVLAVGRSVARETPGAVSLSPASVAGALTRGDLDRLVLPSPNGSTICAALADSGAGVVAGSLRNATAVGRWLAQHWSPGSALCLVPAGERWSDGSLRPAVEDLWGAGAVLAALLAAPGSPVGHQDLSPEARLAATAFAAASFPSDLHGCASGRELAAIGFAGDVDLAAEMDVDDVVPLLRDGAFLPA